MIRHSQHSINSYSFWKNSVTISFSNEEVFENQSLTLSKERNRFAEISYLLIAKTENDERLAKYWDYRRDKKKKSTCQTIRYNSEEFFNRNDDVCIECRLSVLTSKLWLEMLLKLSSRQKTNVDFVNK